MRVTLRLVALFLIFLPGAAFAGGVPVFDGANLHQNILSALRALQSNIHEAEALANDAKNLTKLDFSILNDFRGRFEELFETLGEVEGLMEDFQSLEEKFEELYPEFNETFGQIDGETISKKVNEWIRSNRTTMEGAAKTGAKVLESLPKTQSEVNRLLAESKSSVGILEAAQTGNQIGATIAGQLSSLTALLATFIQSYMSFKMEENSGAALMKKRMDEVVPDYEVRKGKPVTSKLF